MPLVTSRAAVGLLALAGLVVAGLAGLPPGTRTETAWLAPSVASGQSGVTVSGTTTVVHVQGAASIEAPADRAQITLAVRTDAASADQALDANSASMQRVLDALRQAGLDDGALQTGQLNLEVVEEPVPQPYASGGVKPPAPPVEVGPAATAQPAEQPSMTTYRATNTVVATVDDLSRLGAIIQAAVGAGANTAFDLRFSLAHPERLRDRALHQAVESARADAASLADALGGRIESVLEASTTEAAPAVALQSFDSLARTAPPIRPGTVSVSASVELTVELSGATLEAMAPEQPEKPAQLAAATPSAEPATPAQPTGERGAGLGSGGGLAMNPLAQGEDALYGGDAPVAVVASSAAEWHTLADLLPEELEAGPDWDSDVLVGVFLGRRARAGFQVKVERVTQASGGALEVAVSVREPADPSAPMAMTSPYQLVRVAREGLAGSGPYQGEVAILASR